MGLLPLAAGIMLYHQASQPEAYCNAAYQKKAVVGAFSTQRVTTTMGSFEDDSFANCVKALEAAKVVSAIFTVQLALGLCLTCFTAALCGSGARFADDTEKA